MKHRQGLGVADTARGHEVAEFGLSEGQHLDGFARLELLVPCREVFGDEGMHALVEKSRRRIERSEGAEPPRAVSGLFF